MQPDTHIVATGSASPALMKGNQESGAGRWTVIQVPTMSFYEYCKLLNLDQPQLPPSLKITQMLHMTYQEQAGIMLQLSKVQNYFIRYLKRHRARRWATWRNEFWARRITFWRKWLPACGYNIPSAGWTNLDKYGRIWIKLDKIVLILAKGYGMI